MLVFQHHKKKCWISLYSIGTAVFIVFSLRFNLAHSSYLPLNRNGSNGRIATISTEWNVLHFWGGKLIGIFFWYFGCWIFNYFTNFQVCGDKSISLWKKHSICVLVKFTGTSWHIHQVMENWAAKNSHRNGWKQLPYQWKTMNALAKINDIRSVTLHIGCAQKAAYLKFIRFDALIFLCVIVKLSHVAFLLQTRY